VEHHVEGHAPDDYGDQHLVEELHQEHDGGLARLGLEPDFACAFANDLDPAKAKAYRAAFPPGDDMHEGDIWKLTPVSVDS